MLQHSDEQGSQIYAACFLSLLAMMLVLRDSFLRLTRSWWRSKSVLSSLACLLASFWPHADLANLPKTSARHSARLAGHRVQGLAYHCRLRLPQQGSPLPCRPADPPQLDPCLQRDAPLTDSSRPRKDVRQFPGSD